MQQALGLPPDNRAFVAAAFGHSLAADSKNPFRIPLIPEVVQRCRVANS